MGASVRPFLMFQGSAFEAMCFYVGLFDGQVLEESRYVVGEGPPGFVKRAVFAIAGLTVVCIDSPAKHNFSFTPASSLFVECVSEEEIERLATALAEDGQLMMPLGDYGFSRKFAWVNDRFGVSWQLNLA